MRSASGGPRVLLRRLRETMAEQVAAKERLDKIVVLIAANMVAEVCSTYVLRVDNTLELYATEGLNRDAVHRTVLSAHEGLVGLVASEATPLNLSDAQSHPAFSFRPETGEEIYHSFLGVPILRAGNTLGVLVVQNRAKRTYVEEEVEALQTTAMVLAEMIASGELSALAQPGAEPAARHSVHKTGAILSDGIALGHVVLHEPRVIITNYIADDLPKEIKRLDAALTKLRGLVLEEGTANSHVSIVARALGIPAVGEVPNAPGIADPGDAIIVDGTSGSIYVRPSAEIESAYAERVRFRARRQAQYSALRDKPCVTKDGEYIELMINAGLAIDLPHIDDTGSAGIGLFRTELQFMVGQSLPRTSDQLALYRTVLDAAGTKPVTFRTLDIGGDKALPYMETVIEENPALGWRAIRLGLDRPGLLRGQIRALLRAGGGRALKIMFPMISEVAEFDQAKAMVERELTYLRQHGHALPERIDVGTMIEVPALLYQLDELLKKVDFVSVGSNDLFQFMFAVDRGNAKRSERFNTMSAPILRVLRDIVRKADAAKKTASLCGEMASKPLGALALIALGYRSLSMSATGHGPVKALILDLDAKKAEAVMMPLLDAPSGSVSIRQKLTEFAEAEGLSL